MSTGRFTLTKDRTKSVSKLNSSASTSSTTDDACICKMPLTECPKVSSPWSRRRIQGLRALKTVKTSKCAWKRSRPGALEALRSRPATSFDALRQLARHVGMTIHRGDVRGRPAMLVLCGSLLAVASTIAPLGSIYSILAYLRVSRPLTLRGFFCRLAEEEKGKRTHTPSSACVATSSALPPPSALTTQAGPLGGP